MTEPHPTPPPASPPPPAQPQPPRRHDDLQTPLVLLAVGVGTYVLVGYQLYGKHAAWQIFAQLGTQVTLGVALAIIGCYIAGAIMKIDFGPLHVASLKLAAAFVFPSAVGTFVFLPPYSVIVSAILYFLILSWLFGLDLIDTIILAAMIAGVQILVGLILHSLSLVAHP